jgi:4-hydroxy-tetrahydrodipicolinate synthase
LLAFVSMGSLRLFGSITALVTPFQNGAVDEAAFRTHVNWQIESGTHGLVPVGTTGESPTLSHSEHKNVVSWCVQEVAGRVPVIAGAGSNNTAESIELAKHAEKTGADAILVVTPYYNKPTQEGLFAHYSAIHDAVGLPIVLYNIPGRSVIDLHVETMARLSELPRIVGVKDATGNLQRMSQQRAACANQFVQLSGDDATALGFMAHGGDGCISVTSNIAPRLCADFQEAFLRGDFAVARDLHERLLLLHTDLFLESNPAPVKYALRLLGRMNADVRLPLVHVQESTKLKIEAALQRAGVL